MIRLKAQLIRHRSSSFIAVYRLGNFMIPKATLHSGNATKEVQGMRRFFSNEHRLDSRHSEVVLSGRQMLTDSIAGVVSQIVEVTETIKLVQRQILEVDSKIESTKVALNQANLPSEKREILVMELKGLMDKEKALMDKEKALMDEKKALMDKEKALMDEKKALMDEKKALMDKERDLNVKVLEMRNHGKHSSDGWRWRDGFNSQVKSLTGYIFFIISIIGGIGTIVTINKETDRSIEDVYNGLGSSLANAKLVHDVEIPNYVNRPTVESQILNVYNNKTYLEKGSYHIVYGVKGVGKTTTVMHVLGNKPGVVLVRIFENDTNETIINKIFQECGETVKLVADLQRIKISMREATKIRNGHPVTIVFEVERGSSSAQVLSLVKHISKDFALVANVLIVLSEANAVLGFGEDRRQKFIFVDEMTREEAEQFVKKCSPSISSDDFNKFADLCGRNPYMLFDFCHDLLHGLTVDEHIAKVVDSARSDLAAFIHQPILAALKKSPGGVLAEDFKDVKNEGVLLSFPGDVALAMKRCNTIFYDFEARRYKLISKAHQTALKNYDPVTVKGFGKWWL